MSSNKLVSKEFLVPFILITLCFSMWGFANDITNPLVAAFGSVLELKTWKAALVQLAFYGGYGTMAIPAAIFAKKFSYKKGILLGLVLYALGAFLFWPAAKFEQYSLFLIALYILTFGLAFLETTANPFILSLGSEETATRRLNLAQSFNPLGSIIGMGVASTYILTSLKSESVENFSALSEIEKAAMRTHDLAIIRNPYLIIGVVVLVLFVVIAIAKIPRQNRGSNVMNFGASMKRLWVNVRFREGVFAQLCYVGAQILCWTFIIHYAGNLGITKANAQKLNMVAMASFISFRFLGTYLLKFVNSGKLLLIFATCALTTIIGAILINGYVGLGCLMATSAFMSIMFPTIYGIALKGIKEDSELGAALLVMAIVGGALLPPLQGMMIDKGTILSMPAVNFSFIMPAGCFIVIMIFGYRAYKVYRD